MLVERRAPARAAIKPRRRERRASEAEAPSACLDIGLLNNMPDAALAATERQFISLLGVAAGTRPVRLHFYSLAEMPRSAEARAHIATLYADPGELPRRRLDGLFVTGSEPRAARLDEEPYWPALARLIDWAAANTASTIWSCLAAHAAVLHLHGIERRPLAAKCFGVFDCARASADLLLAGAPAALKVPHSRHNGLEERELAARGYRILTRSTAAGVDMFARRSGRSQFVFFQGHPEYDASSLLREYRRDLGRYLRGERTVLPPMPQGYFALESEMAMAEFAARAEASRDPALIAAFPGDADGASVPEASWRATAVPVFRNWLASLAIAKAAAA